MNSLGENPNPYVGLRPFKHKDSLFFFGRRDQTADLLEQLHTTRFLAVVGSSGCGKSSLIRAGLIPSLLGGFLLEECDKWQIATMKPGDSPLRNLAAALCQLEDTDKDHTKIEQLWKLIIENHTQAVVDNCSKWSSEATNLFLLIDQFEEIFSFRGTEEEEQLSLMSAERRRERYKRRAEAADFVDLMLELPERTEAPVYVAMAMRTDFLGDCDLFYGLPEAMNRSQYLVPRLTRSQLRQAIEGPALLSGAQVSPRLSDRLLNELGDRPDRLPVMQHVLMRTWDLWYREGETIPIGLEHYRTAGGLEKALSDHAEEAVRDNDLISTGQIFKCLTGTDWKGRRVRRPTRMSELRAVTGMDGGAVTAIIKRFREGGRNFLIVSESAEADDPLVDISHESLIRQWRRLTHWVDEERESRDQFLELLARARGHRTLLQGSDLALALDWKQRSKPTQEWAQRYCTEKGDFNAAMEYLTASELDVIHRERSNIESRIRSGAGWFFWLSIASLVNTALVLGGADWAFVFSLSMTDLVDRSTAVLPFELLFDLLITGVFVLFGYFARQGEDWAFRVGISLYTIDAFLILFVADDYWGLAFHVWVLFGLYGGLRACKELRIFDQNLMRD